MTQLIIDKGIYDFEALLDHVKSLPYGRNSNRKDLSLVISEGKGTCSSKHALVAEVADLNKISDVQLVLAIYKMNNRNTPGIGDHIENAELEYIPEAHCYLSVNDQLMDITKASSDINKLLPDVLYEEFIKPEQVGEYKVEFHQKYIREWISDNNVPMAFNEVWGLRERCIRELSQ